MSRSSREDRAKPRRVHGGPAIGGGYRGPQPARASRSVEPEMLGDGMASKAGKEMKGRKRYLDSKIDEMSR